MEIEKIVINKIIILISLFIVVYVYYATNINKWTSNLNIIFVNIFKLCDFKFYDMNKISI
jgi:hypothetical protein